MADDEANKASDSFREWLEANPTEEAAMKKSAAAAFERIKQEFQPVVDYQQLWQKAWGVPMPKTVEEMQSWAIRVGWDGERVVRGKWTLRELVPFIEGKIQQLRDFEKLSQVATSQSQSDLPNDGPDPAKPGIFYWRNESVILPTASWEFCCAIRQRAGIGYAEVGKAVWGDDLTKASTIKSSIKRLNDEMKIREIPFRWVSRREKIYLA